MVIRWGWLLTVRKTRPKKLWPLIRQSLLGLARNQAKVKSPRSDLKFLLRGRPVHPVGRVRMAVLVRPAPVAVRVVYWDWAGLLVSMPLRRESGTW